MPPKQRITREMILETAFDMFCREGLAVVNARSVAKELNCSTQPIFSYFSGMDDLKTSLEAKARELFEEEIGRTLGGDEPLLEGCLAYYRFAVEQPKLFWQLFLSGDEKRQGSAAEAGKALDEKVVMPLAQRTGKDAKQLKAQCVRLWAFTHGLASLGAMDLMEVSASEAEAMIRDEYSERTSN